MLNLSLLRDEILLVDEHQRTLTVGEIRTALLEGEVEVERLDENLTKAEIERKKWFLAREETWSFDSRQMVFNYLENANPNEEVEGWFCEARDHFDYEHDLFKKMNEMLNKVLAEEPKLTTYYSKGEKIVFDL